MVKRNFKVIAALALTLSLSSGFVTTHASTFSGSQSSTLQKVDQQAHKHKNHEGSISSVLKSKLGFTDAQIENAKKSGKTAFDLAKEKGVSPDQLKSMVIDAKSQKIDEAIKEGKITKEKGDTIKSRLKEKMQMWDGSFSHEEHKEGYLNSILKNKLGYTDVQIESAKKSGKTAFDLAKEKGVTPDQLRSMILNEKSQKIDEAVKEGKISKEKADTIKAHLKDRIQKWDGCLDHKDGCKKTE